MSKPGNHGNKELVDVFYKTLMFIEKGLVELPGSTVSIDETIICPPIKTETPRNLYVVNEDCIDVAQEYALNRNRVCLLNMASDACPGGGVKKGCKAQEEVVFEKS